MHTYPFFLLKNRLATIAGLDEVDYYLGQDKPGKDGVIMIPGSGAYIEFMPANMDTLPGRIQKATTQFRVHLITEALGDDGNRLKKDLPDDHMRVVDEIFSALQGFTGKASDLPEFAQLLDTPSDHMIISATSRTGIIVDHVPRSVMHTIQTFRSVFWDFSAKKQYIVKRLPPDITKINLAI